jgi:hypothetical protein
MLEIVAADAPDAPHRIAAGLADDGERSLGRKGDDVGGGVHEAVSLLLG